MTHCYCRMVFSADGLDTFRIQGASFNTAKTHEHGSEFICDLVLLTTGKLVEDLRARGFGVAMVCVYRFSIIRDLCTFGRFRSCKDARSDDHVAEG